MFTFYTVLLGKFYKAGFSVTRKCIKLFSDPTWRKKFGVSSVVIFICFKKQGNCVVLPWVCVSAVNDTDNVVFININTYWGTVSERSEMTERKCSQECFITCLENMRPFSKLDCPWLQRRGCTLKARTLPSVRNSGKAAVPPPPESLWALWTADVTCSRRLRRAYFTWTWTYFIVFFF